MPTKSSNNTESTKLVLTPEWTSTNNVVRFPVEKTRLPGESRENYTARRGSFTKMEDIFQELCAALEALDEQEGDADGM